MKLHKRTIGILIAFILIALVGLIALQYVLIVNAIELKEQAFKQNVNAAMNTIVQKLEAGETFGNVFKIAVKEPQMKSRMQMYNYTTDDSLISVSVTGNSPSSFSRVFVSSDHSRMKQLPMKRPPIRWEGERIWYNVNTPQHVLIRAFNLTTGKDTIILNTFKSAGEYSIDVDNKKLSSGEFIFKFLSDSVTSTVAVENGKIQSAIPDKKMYGKREEMVGRVVDKLFLDEQVPIEKRLTPVVLDSVIGKSLDESGINLPFAYGVISERNDSLQIVQPALFKNELQSSEFKARLFPNDIFMSFNQLALYFPDQKIYILKQIGPLLALTIVFMGIIVYCFVFTIRTIVRQKEFSIRLMDFINNMTHEFKTPISTISVAAETMMHPGVIHDEEKIKRYGTVIQDENFRMKHQVDKILQMAVLEEGTYKLKYTSFDIHEIITKAVDNAVMQIGNKGGTVTPILEAKLSFINGDHVHITNVINNILDNSIKYSQESPEISVKTFNADGNIHIVITGNGIGIAAEDQRHVFVKYFRVHTGNVHNVKGFGLGLSYVKLMTEAHGGNIALQSEPGKGTTVDLSFPVIQIA